MPLSAEARWSKWLRAACWPALGAVLALAGSVFADPAPDAMRVVVAPAPEQAEQLFVHTFTALAGHARPITASTADPIAGPEARQPATQERSQTDVRFRGAPPPASQGKRVTVAVGAAAARRALAQPGVDTLLITMVGRLDVEALKLLPGWRQPARRQAVLMGHAPMRDLLQLMEATLPDRRRLGVIATAESRPLVNDLLAAGAGRWLISVHYAPDEQLIGPAIHAALDGAEALLLLPDRVGAHPAASQAILRAAASARVPVIGASEAMLRTGGLAAALPFPDAMARQAHRMLERLRLSGPAEPLVEWPAEVRAQLNAGVAQSLGVTPPVPWPPAVAASNSAVR